MVIKVIIIIVAAVVVMPAAMAVAKMVVDVRA